MIELNLTESAAMELKQTVDERLAELLRELVHTDDRSYHQDLKSRCERLEQLQQQIGARLPAGRT